MGDSTNFVNLKLKKIRESFIKQLPKQLEAIREAYNLFVQDGSSELPELEELHRKIHTLKGASATFGLKGVSTTAAAAEKLAKELMTSGGEPDRSWHKQLQEHFKQMEQETGLIDLGLEMDFQAERLVIGKDLTAEDVKKRVYVCESDSFQRLTLATQIECFGFEVVSFGELDHLRRAIANEPPSAVVMDISFPGGVYEGATAMQELQLQTAHSVPIVYLSSHNDISYRLAAARAGSSAYFIKPVNVSELCARLGALTELIKPEPYRIMVIDDDPQMADYHALILQQAGMTTQTVTDPFQVMEPLYDFKPDLILMDMYMPGCNGMELAKAIRQINSQFSIPIVYLSSETDTDKQFDAIRVGGDEFLTKPIKPQHLISSVTVRAERMNIIRSYMLRDGMTGLYNHTTTKEQLETATALALRNSSELCFAMIDVDFFKKVNDNYGHPTGDKVLISLARLLKHRLRSSDIVGRFGGEEFAVILPNCNAEAAQVVMNNLREAFAAINFQGKDGAFNVTFSCGVASFSTHKDTPSLCNAADEALYAAKCGGRNKVVAAE